MLKKIYAADVEFLKNHTKIVELAADDGGLVAVAPGYQGRVMTSSLAGAEAASFGWLDREFIESGRDDPHFNNYGGEDRFWLGPEAGRFSLWFKQGEEFDLDHWTTPAAFGRGAFAVESQTGDSVSMAARFDVRNYSGTLLACSVKRTVSLLDRERAGELLGATVGEELAMVAFESANELTNAGDNDWARQTGLPSIWTLGQFNAQPGCWVIVPFRPGDESALGPAATIDYFGELPAERYKLSDESLLFCSDGQWRSKIGISAARAKPLLGSYDFRAEVLTVVQFSLPENAAELPYVNSRWEYLESLDENYAGDVVNAYSDGPGSGHDTKTTPFYEMETSSPAAELRPGESISHTHRTLHFAGPFDALNDLARNVLGVDLKEVS